MQLGQTCFARLIEQRAARRELVEVPPQGGTLLRIQMATDGAVGQLFVQRMQRAIGEFLIETRNDPGIEVKDGAVPAFLFAQQGRDRIQHGQHLGIQPIHCQHQVIPGG
ncbi:hypothetical protein D3C71_1835730 [compost metagenome]